MTTDMCPFLSDKASAKQCPTCKTTQEEVKMLGHEDIIKKCLVDIKKEIKSAQNSPRLKEILLLELYKLKRLTTPEEEEIFEVVGKRYVQDILILIEKLKPKMNNTEEGQFNLHTGDVLFNLGELQRALDHYLLASEIDPKDKRTWNNLGVTMVRRGKIKGALPYYDKAIALDSTFGSAWFNKGKALFKLGVKKKALACFKKAVKYSPENKSAWNNLGVTLRQLKKFKESIKCYDKALKIHSEYPWAWHNKGVALMELKRYKDAMECFDRALQIDPGYEPSKEIKKEVMRKVM